MSRVFLFILDCVGIGGAPDAAKFGDEGANTLGHIADHRKLNIPNLVSLGPPGLCKQPAVRLMVLILKRR